MSSYTKRWSFLERLAANMSPAGKNLAGKNLAGPYEFDFATGGVWRYASDGRGIILVKKPYWKFNVAVAAPDGDCGKRILPYLSIPEGEVFTTSLMGLRDFLGAGIWMEPCPACDGRSKKSEYLHCSFCDCDGEVSPEPRFAWVCGMPLDANRLACLLQAFEEEQVQLIVRVVKGDNFTHDDRILYVFGKDFRVLLMGMRPSLEEQDEWQAAPRFPKEKS